VLTYEEWDTLGVFFFLLSDIAPDSQTMYYIDVGRFDRNQTNFNQHFAPPGIKRIAQENESRDPLAGLSFFMEVTNG
jgi:hypothetical protein